MNTWQHPPRPRRAQQRTRAAYGLLGLVAVVSVLIIAHSALKAVNNHTALVLDERNFCGEC